MDTRHITEIKTGMFLLVWTGDDRSHANCARVIRVFDDGYDYDVTNGAYVVSVRGDIATIHETGHQFPAPRYEQIVKVSPEDVSRYYMRGYAGVQALLSGLDNKLSEGEELQKLRDFIRRTGQKEDFDAFLSTGEVVRVDEEEIAF